MRALLDTNILISAVVLRSPIAKRAYAITLSDGNTLIAPTYVLDELCRVTARKWPEQLSAVDRFILEAPYEEVADPGPGFGIGEISIRDPKDLPILRAALAARVDAVVSGDKDFAAAYLGSIPIYTTRAFISAFS